jgi:hypothetical protein
MVMMFHPLPAAKPMEHAAEVRVETSYPNSASDHDSHYFR